MTSPTNLADHRASGKSEGAREGCENPAVLFKKEQWQGLEDGSITLAFRRWKRPTVKAGGTLQSPAGLLAIDAVEVVRLREISDDDARRAGYDSKTDLVAALRGDGTLYRIELHRIGDDPRASLREQSDLTPAEIEELRIKLNRLAWALPVLRTIGDNAGVVSTELAPQLGFDRPAFKQRVRRLKALGLTESLPVGYRLSPRGRAVLERLDADGADAARAET
jgi:hypothetical protein